MKASCSALTGFAFAALLGTASLTGCGGGGGSSPAVPTTTTTTTTQAPTSGSVPIGSLNLNQAASTTPVNVTSSTPAGPSVDLADQSPIAVSGQPQMATMESGGQHSFAGALRGPSTSAAHRSAKDVQVNSPFDLSYHGGPVLGSAVSHDLFLNCTISCRNAVNFNPGQFIFDLGQDQFITLLYQYLVTPGVIDTVPLNGRYTKGQAADVTGTYAPPRPNSTNPYFGELAIWLQVLNAAGPPGHPNGNMGGGGLGHIYHVFLPKNVDTCFENPPGQPGSSCYSPDNGSTFVFCAYHGAFTATSGNQRQTYLYTVEPYQDVNGCRNAVHNQPLPNAASPSVDPADPGYSTLSHELFETISDPLLNAWYNNFSGGNEIGDICAEFDNFVTVNGHPYVLQSEYSDVHHFCVSGNLSGQAQTPQQQL